MSQSFDLENRHIVIVSGHEDPINRWQTSVECVLSRTNSHDEKQYAWLSHECRSEHLSPHIFDDEYYEFVVVKGWNGTVYLRGGSYNYGFNPIKISLARLRKRPTKMAIQGQRFIAKKERHESWVLMKLLNSFKKRMRTKRIKFTWRLNTKKARINTNCQLLVGIRTTHTLQKTRNISSRFPVMSFSRTRKDFSCLMWPRIFARMEPNPSNSGSGK